MALGDVNKGHIVTPHLHRCGATSPGSLFCCQRRFHCIYRLGWDCAAAFSKKNISPLILVQIRSWGTAAVDTGKADGTEILTPRWNPAEWRNQGLIWSQCPQAQTIWQPESDGFTKTIIHHFSPVSNQLAGLLWAAAPSLTVWHIDG